MKKAFAIIITVMLMAITLSPLCMMASAEIKIHGYPRDQRLEVYR